MVKSFISSRNIIISIILLLVCVILAFFAYVVGISDNPPGIALAFLSTISFLLAFTHSLRSSKQFRYLIYISGLGFVISVILHNVFEGIASNIEGTSIAQGFLNGIGVAFFLIAIFICPIGLIIGAIGTAVISSRERRSKQRSSDV